MRVSAMHKLQPGDQVLWSDPDEDTCSRTVTIKAIDAFANVARITCEDGSVIEAFARELS